MNLQTITDTIRAYTQVQKSPYGDFRSSNLATQMAVDLVRAIFERSKSLPTEISPADGVALTYRGSISVEVSDDGEILVLDSKNNDESFTDIMKCADRVACLLRT